MTNVEMPDKPGIQIVYDGDCPFCSSYVRMTKLRQAIGEVELVNARESHPLVDDIKAKGFDLNQGMVAKFRGQFYAGADCIHLLAILTEPRGFWNRIVSRLFQSGRRSRLAYPFLKFGRDLALRLLGRSQIS